MVTNEKVAIVQETKEIEVTNKEEDNILPKNNSTHTKIPIIIELG